MGKEGGGSIKDLGAVGPCLAEEYLQKILGNVDVVLIRI